MKKKPSLKSLLGVPQEELAALLGISRSQLSMYESGKRDLPVSALQELARMLAHVQNTTKENKALQQLKAKENQRAQQQLEKDLQETAYLLQLTHKRIQALEKRRHESFCALQLVEYLNTKGDKQQTKISELLKNSALTQLQKNSEGALERLVLKQQTLEQRTQELERRIKSRQNDSPQDFV